MKKCKDPLARTLWGAGFRGVHLRVAWAVAMRESNGNASESSYPDLGLFQLNAPSWQGSKYWPANIYDADQNARAAFRMVRDLGWGPWGLRVSGGQVSYNFSSYGMWSSWQHQNWIVIPFQRYWSQFPSKCKEAVSVSSRR
jgi:hypothetical protein